jgi:hypothetical protein
MDDLVGVLMDEPERLGIGDTIFVVLMADNGPMVYDGQSGRRAGTMRLVCGRLAFREAS